MSDFNKNYMSKGPTGPGSLSNPEAEVLWDADAAVNGLFEESQVMESGDLEATAKRLMEEALPMAVMSVVHVATHSINDKLRFDAAKYIIERNMGAPAREGTLKPSEDPLDQLFAKLDELQKAGA